MTLCILQYVDSLHLVRWSDVDSLHLIRWSDVDSLHLVRWSDVDSLHLMRWSDVDSLHLVRWSDYRECQIIEVPDYRNPKAYQHLTSDQQIIAGDHADCHIGMCSADFLSLSLLVFQEDTGVANHCPLPDNGTD